MVAAYPLEEQTFQQIVRDGHGATVVSSNGGQVSRSTWWRDREEPEAWARVKHVMCSPTRLLPKGRPLRNVPLQQPTRRAADAELLIVDVVCHGRATKARQVAKCVAANEISVR